MAARKLDILYIDNDAGHLKYVPEGLRELTGSNVESTGFLIDALDIIERKKFDVVICDLAMEPVSLTAEGGPKSFSAVDFLKLCEQRFPEAELAIYSGLQPKEPLRGVRFISKQSSEPTKKVIDFVEEVKSRPVKKQARQRIDLRQFARPILHVDPTGKRQMLKLIVSYKDSLAMLRMLRQGWRPLGKERAIKLLEHSRKTYRVHGGKPLPGTIFDIHNR